MKRILSRSALAFIAIAVLLSIGLTAAATTVTVPGDYGTITAALAAAYPEESTIDKITVTAAYTGDGEKFPILVQKDNITIEAVGDVTITGEASKAVFVVGAYRQYVEANHRYEVVPVTGVTIVGFTIGDLTDSVIEDIGILIKEADFVNIYDNVIRGPIEGIRLLDASHCSIIENTVLDATGIGIFLENAFWNFLIDNIVDGCSLGLFLFESDANYIVGGIITDNDNGGVVLNDSDENLLGCLDIEDNTGWGVRFVHADNNGLAASTIAYNSVGGVELAGSVGNSIGGEWAEPILLELSAQQLNAVAEEMDGFLVMLYGNVIVSNGDPTDDYDDPQVVLTSGDKAIFENDVFDDYNDLGNLPEFVEEKIEVYDKLYLLEGWVEELDYELWEIRQKIASAIGMCDQEQTPSSTIVDFINNSIIVEKHFITQPEAPKGIIERDFWDDNEEHRPAAMADPTVNFTLEDAQDDFLYGWTGLTYDKLDFYEDGAADDFGLDYDDDGDPLTEDPEDDISWDKLGIIDILLLAIRAEIYNDYTNGWEGDTVDSLKEKLVELLDMKLITTQDKTDLEEKLDAILGFIGQIEVISTTINEGLVDEAGTDVDDYLEDAITELEKPTPGYTAARAKLLDAKDKVEELIAIKLEIYGLIEDIRYKLCLVDLELPPFPRVNSLLVGKKEKPFTAITPGEIDGMKTDIIAGLNGDTTAQGIRVVVEGGGTFVAGDISTAPVSLRASTDNLVANNLITSDLPNPGARNVGIIIDARENKFVNNLFTNEWIPELGQVLRYITAADITDPYKENLRLDVAILLYGDENEIYYNAIEFVNTGMERGGKRKWKDVQVEYVFDKLALAAYWPGPGFKTPESCGDGTPRRPIKGYDADHFELREVDWVPVFSVTSRDVIVDVAVSIRVKRNRIEDNFFEYTGVAIYILDAESNHIEQNLFYQSSNGGIVFSNMFTEFMPNIILKHNDYFGGLSVVNQTTLPVGANEDYTPAEGQEGHAPSIGPVNGPLSTGGPYAYENFTAAKLELLLGEDNLWSELFDTDNPLPPNVGLIWGPWWIDDPITLPAEKPRHPDTIFLGQAPGPGPAEECCWFYEDWNLISVPVDPANPDPTAVFDEVTGDLYLCAYDAATGTWLWAGDVPTGLSGQGNALTEVDPMGAYYLWLPEVPGDLLVCVTGTAVEGDQAIQLGDAGWYTFGVPYEVNWDDSGQISVTQNGDTRTLAEAVVEGWIWDEVWEYDAEAGEWIVTSVTAGTVLDPCKGYWFYTYVDDLVIGFSEEAPVGPPGPPPTPSAIKSAHLKSPGTPPIPGAPVSFQAEKLEFTNYPNPVTDVHTTTFAVKGAMAMFVDAIKVQIFDLSGQKVYEEEMAGTSIDWHTDNDYGEYLANGVYLYKMYARVQGQWVVSEVKKLAILR